MADATIALTAWEAGLIVEMFRASPARVHVVPNGVEETFLEAPPRTRGPWLVCTATITKRKRVFELAQAAVAAHVPVWIIGRPYSPTDPYAVALQKLSQAHPQWLRYEGPIHERARLAEIYRQARGFVLISTMESLSLSALEAAACECPLLLSDLPWARSVFGAQARYCPIASAIHTAAVLRTFYERAPALKAPAKPLSWSQVATQLKAIYRRLLSNSA